MKNSLTKLFIPVLLLIILAGVSIVLADDNPPNFVDEPVADPSGFDSMTVKIKDTDKIEQFWTNERLEAAIPVDTIELDEAPERFDEFEEAYDIPFKAVPGSLPSRNAIQWAKEQYPLEWLAVANAVEKEIGVEGADGTDVIDGVQATDDTRYQPYPPAFNRYFVNKYVSPRTVLWWKYPWSTMGRLYFQVPNDNRTFVCSATVFSKRAIWTAGHCVYTPGSGWHRNMVFIPAYRNGAAPYGNWVGVDAASPKGWTQSANLAYDIGVVVAGDKTALNDTTARTIQSVVGSLGTSWGGSPYRLYNRFGYPANFASGKYLNVCEGSLSARRSKPGPDPIGVGCDMLGGSSGGAYIDKYAPYFSNGKNFVNSVHSFHIAGKNQEGYGPYFGSAAEVLYRWGLAK